eukprot:CCRYP_009195-RB/>CCRYP_009195-RB protein AED:0.29 eAED:0.34 QI:0/0/0/1/0/0/3/0/675
MGATPPEEIAKQHLAAVSLIESHMPCSPRINHGAVPLYWKTKPTCPHLNVETCDKDPDTASVEVSGVAHDSNDANPNSPPWKYPEWCISSLGQVDVTSIVNLITEGVNDPATINQDDAKPANVTSKSIKSTPKQFSPTNLWDEDNASRNNVRITRPSHDAWGIKKIMLVFCDDFLNTIYTLPWYQTGGLNNKTSTKSVTIGEKMHKAIQPILDVLQIQQSQMVRCLLAALPPGVTIPVHHDTGEWVKYTHRVHVPIIVPDPTKVLFRCGPTEQSMERVDCSPGHVFEMNNQAKHAVTNGGEDFRVHLILDYVEPSFFEMREAQNCPVQRVNLAPGEIITQTRRSIDRALEAGSRDQPSFLILGAQKAGTTSLYEYMTQHPWVVKAKRRETHCLDWRWNDALKSTEDRRAHCLEFYHAKAMRPYPSLRTGDSTPSYLLDYYRVIPRLKECFAHGPQLIILVRDPIKRAASHYAMVTSSDGSPEQMKARGMEWREKSFQEVLEQDIKNMKEDGLLPYWDMESKTVNSEIFDTFINSREEDEAWERYVRTRVPLNTGSYSPLARGMYALQCRQWFRSFSKDKFLVMKLEDMSSREKGVQWVVNKTMEHLGVPQFEVPDVDKKNAREYVDPLEEKEELKGWLKRFFAPHNERFGKMIVEELGISEIDASNIVQMHCDYQ